VGFLVIFWATPDMSVGHLLFAAASTAYIMVGVRLEEHDLKEQLGAPYEEYMKRVPRFIPSARRRTLSDAHR
jgi:protein-S-isoprenylcysteine O-methyltransferase Ste14